MNKVHDLHTHRSTPTNTQPHMYNSINTSIKLHIHTPIQIAYTIHKLMRTITKHANSLSNTCTLTVTFCNIRYGTWLIDTSSIYRRVPSTRHPGRFREPIGKQGRVAQTVLRFVEYNVDQFFHKVSKVIINTVPIIIFTYDYTSYVK